MPELSPYMTGGETGGGGMSAAEITAIVQAQLAYLQNASGGPSPAYSDGNQQVSVGLKSILSAISQAAAQGVALTTPANDHLTGETDRRFLENADAKSRETINQRQAGKAQAKHFAEDEGQMIEAQKKQNEGDSRAAEALRARVRWMQEFKRLKDAGAPDDRTAADGATEKVQTLEKAQQDRHAQSYARLVNARDGAADTARVASAAHEDRLRHTPNISLEELRKDMNRNHLEATHAATRKNYSRK